MTSAVVVSQLQNGRQSKIKINNRLVKKSEHFYSDYCEDNKDDIGGGGGSGEDKLNGQRSLSLSTLQQSNTTPVQPRMAQLETLEAKMASIEVSLSTTPRRKKNGSLGNVSIGTTGGMSTKINLSKSNFINNNNYNNNNNDSLAKELENLRNALRDKENIIDSLKGQLNTSRLPTPILRINPNVKLDGCKERKQIEDRLARIKTQMDNKQLTITHLKNALQHLQITDNIDVRIEQAELEYQLGREELNALSLLEEARALQHCLEDVVQLQKPHSTLYSCTKEGTSNGGGPITLHAVEVKYDAKSPRFGAAQKDNNLGLFVQWALDDTQLCKGDRVVEVNGKLVLNKTKDDMLRLLAVAPDPAQIVVLRTSYSSSSFQSSNELAYLRTELEVVRERAVQAERMKNDNLRLTHRISYLEEQVAELLQRKNPSENNRRNVTSISITSPPPSPTPPSAAIFQKGPQVTALVANLPGMEVDNREMLRTLRPRSQHVSSTHISPSSVYRTSRHLDYNSEDQIRRHHRPSRKSTQNRSDSERLQDTRSVKSLDSLDSEPIFQKTNSKISDESRSAYLRPKPPKKPIRLSLHRAQSLQSVETNNSQLSLVPISNKIDERKPVKRNHKGETPTIVKIERPSEQPPQPPQELHSLRSTLRWPTAFHPFSRGGSRNGHLSDGGKWC